MNAARERQEADKKKAEQAESRVEGEDENEWLPDELKRSKNGGVKSRKGGKKRR